MLSGEEQEVADRIHGLEEGLIGLSHEVRRHPEIGFQGYKTMDAIETYLKTQGVEVERNYCEIPTSFRVVKRDRGRGSAVAFLARYDALGGVGHGCGHSIMAICAVGVFLDTASKIDQYDGEIWLLDTPAEEGGTGEVLILERGGFDGVEFALMVRPTGDGVERNYVNRGEKASGFITVSSRGKSTHSSAPSAGINALSAAISVFNQIDMIRPTFGVQGNVNGVILKGGTAGNIIPEFSKCESYIRAEAMERAGELIGMIKRCIRRTQNLTGAAAKIETELICTERYPCLSLCKAFGENMGELGIGMCYPKPGELFGSPGISDASMRIPAIHDYLSIADDASIEAHSTGYARVAAEPRADEICILGAEDLAMTAFDILTDGKLREESIAYHKEVISAFYGKEWGILGEEEL